MTVSRPGAIPGRSARAITPDDLRAGRGEAGRRAASARARRYALKLLPVLDTIAGEAGRTAQILAGELTRRAIRKPRGGTVWTPVDVRKLLGRLEGLRR